MKKRTRNKAVKSGRDRIINVAITVLSILLVILIITFGFSASRTREVFVNDPASILRDIDAANYDMAVKEVAENRANGIDENDDREYIEPYAVVDYFNASIDYKMYSESGDTSKASEARSRMNDAYAKMGNMKYKASEIDSIIAGETKSE